jgi:tetratricopeptide (TPR) repeat protein
VGRFARGFGLAQLTRLEEAGEEASRLRALEDVTRNSGEELFTRNIRVLRLELDGWLLKQRGDPDAARILLAEAAALEASTPKHAVTPAPTLPAEELLGDFLLEQKRPADALAAYRRSLALYPRRFNSLLGAARAAQALGDPAARGYYQELIGLAGNGKRTAPIEEARAVLARP